MPELSLNQQSYPRTSMINTSKSSLAKYKFNDIGVMKRSLLSIM